MVAQYAYELDALVNHVHVTETLAFESFDRCHEFQRSTLSCL